MQYVLLVYGDEQLLEAQSSSECETIADACRDNHEMLRQSGHLLAAQGLHSSHSATTVRVQHGKVSVADGPVAQTREQLIEIFAISARDLNEAIQVAATMPQARRGPIEIRPLR
jgi:hypothetical protein